MLLSGVDARIIARNDRSYAPNSGIAERFHKTLTRSSGRSNALFIPFSRHDSRAERRAPLPPAASPRPPAGLLLEFLERVRLGIGIEQRCIAIARAGRKESEDMSSLALVDRLGSKYLPRRRQLHELIST